jgi:hypothetical protein
MATTDPTTGYGQIQTSITRQDPEIEKYRLGLLQDVQQFIKQQVGQGAPSALDYRVAPISAAEQAAVSAAQSGIGAFQPFLSAGESAIQGGQNILTQGAVPALQQAMMTLGGGQEFINQAAQLAAMQRGVPGTYLQGAGQGIGQATQLGTTLGLGGIGSLAGTGAMFNPYMSESFMSPYESAAVQQALGDIQRQGDIAQQGLRAQAVGAGAFGGSRQAIAEQELQRNVLEQQGRTAAQMRAAGFESAAQRAQQAFEQALARQQAGAQAGAQIGLNLGQLGLSGSQALGQLGLGYGQLGQQEVEQLSRLAAQQSALGQGLGSLAGQFGQFGTQMGQLGVQQAGIGEIGQNVLSSQLQNALAAGGLQRGIDQSALEAARMSNVARQAYPYQQYGFLSDIYAGIPTSQSVTTATSAPSVSPFQTAIGLGISGLSAAAGAQKAGLF